jgi:hypothetical protein
VLLACLGLGRTLAFSAGLGRGGWTRDWRTTVLLQLAAIALVGEVSRREGFGWLALAFAAVGVSSGAAYYLALYRSLEGEGSRGFKSGMHEASLLGGVLLGSLGGGWAASTWGLRVPYPMLGVLCILLVVAQAALNLWSGRARGATVG